MSFIGKKFTSQDDNVFDFTLDYMQNSGYKMAQPYVTGMANFKNVIDVLDKYDCTYQISDYCGGKLIDNVQCKNLGSTYLEMILQLRGSILFV